LENIIKGMSSSIKKCKRALNSSKIETRKDELNEDIFHELKSSKESNKKFKF